MLWVTPQYAIYRCCKVQSPVAIDIQSSVAKKIYIICHLNLDILYAKCPSNNIYVPFC